MISIRVNIILQVFFGVNIILKSALFHQSHTLEELSVFTQYLVSLRVFNPEGAGPDTIVVVMTDEGGEHCHNVNIISDNHIFSSKY